MRRVIPILVGAVLLVASPHPADAQSGAAVTAPTDSMTAFTKAWVAVMELRDKAYADLAHPSNKKLEDQARLRTKLKADIAAALKVHGLTQQEFDHWTQLVSSDDARRKTFEALVADLSGKKTPTPPST